MNILCLELNHEYLYCFVIHGDSMNNEKKRPLEQQNSVKEELAGRLLGKIWEGIAWVGSRSRRKGRSKKTICMEGLDRAQEQRRLLYIPLFNITLFNP